MNDWRTKPAFPLHQGAVVEDDMGMTLRDYFAAAALGGYLAAGRVAMDPVSPGLVRQELAVACYRTADAMLKAREES